MEAYRLSDDFLQLFCEKNSDGTKKLRLKGNELFQRFGKRLVAADMTKVALFLKNHPEVNSLNICYNDIGDDGLNILSHDVLSFPNNLEHVNLMGCDITIDGLKQLFFASRENHFKIKTFRLSANKIGPHGGHMVALTIPYVPTLEYLDLGDTDQTVDSIDNIFLNLWWSRLKVLNISRVVPHCTKIIYDPKDLAESIEEFFRLNNTVVEFHCQKCRFDAHDFEIMLTGFNYNSSLQFLDLGYNLLNDFGVELLANWLKTRPNLTALNIAGNRMQDPSARALAYAMPYSKIRFLDIRDNLITDGGMMFLLQTVRKPYMLRYFFIWGNHFGDRTIRVILRLLKATILEQEGIDVKVYSVDGVLHVAQYPVHHYNQRYYEVMDHGCAVELKIKRNKVEKPGGEKPRALIDFRHINRFPPLDKPSI